MTLWKSSPKCCPTHFLFKLIYHFFCGKNYPQKFGLHLYILIWLAQNTSSKQSSEWAKSGHPGGCLPTYVHSMDSIPSHSLVPIEINNCGLVRLVSASRQHKKYQISFYTCNWQQIWLTRRLE
jgi:hypothetical protein